MKEVQYNGTADKATITDEQWEKAGVRSKTVTWQGNGDVQEIADEAAEHLESHEPRRFGPKGQSEAKSAQATTEASGGGTATASAGSTVAPSAGTTPNPQSS